jgi:polyisoprenoid-binding protein YceI
MLSVLGHNPTIAIRDFTGEAIFDPLDASHSSLRIEINATSLEVTDDIKASDRKEMESTMNEKVLQSSKYPTIQFEAVAISAKQLNAGRYQVQMNGTLQLRGVTGKLPVTCQIVLLGDSLRASGDFSLSQSDYGIPLVSVAGGALKLKDELKFSFDIVARKQD